MGALKEVLKFEKPLFDEVAKAAGSRSSLLPSPATLPSSKTLDQFLVRIIRTESFLVVFVIFGCNLSRLVLIVFIAFLVNFGQISGQSE